MVTGDWGLDIGNWMLNSGCILGHSFFTNTLSQAGYTNRRTAELQNCRTLLHITSEVIIPPYFSRNRKTAKLQNCKTAFKFYICCLKNKS
jgi:hypothetical protein